MKVVVDYTDREGRRTIRTIQPIGDGLFFGNTENYPDTQWLLCAYDWNSKQDCVLAMKGVHSWTPAEHIDDDANDTDPEDYTDCD